MYRRVLNSSLSRFSYIDKNGQCIIGMEKKAMIPLIVFDVLVNVSLESHSGTNSTFSSKRSYYVGLFDNAFPHSTT